MAPAKTQPALLGGAAIGVLSALPIISAGNLCCCLWVVAGGALAAYLLQQNHPEPIDAGDGALVGLMAGAVGAVVGALLSIPINLMLVPFQADLIERMLAASRDMPPELRGFFESVRATAGGAVMGLAWFISLMFWLAISSVFGAVGGLLGALVFRKPAGPALPPPIPGDY